MAEDGGGVEEDGKESWGCGEAQSVVRIGIFDSSVRWEGLDEPGHGGRWLRWLIAWIVLLLPG